MQRLQKVIAESGYASRRKAEELIKMGKVYVNGVKVTEMGFKVSGNDLIDINGKPLKKEDKEYYFNNTDEELEQSYFKPVLQDVPKARRESKKQRYRVGCINREDYFNDALVELVKQKVEKFKATNNMPKESASQNILQDVLELFSGDKKKYEEFMQKAKYITTSCGYK